MNKIKYYCLRYQPYLLGVAFFLAIFLVWAIGRALGFASLHSLLAGIGVFLLLSAGYVLLLYRGAGQHHNLEGLLRDDADQAVLSAPRPTGKRSACCASACCRHRAPAQQQAARRLEQGRTVCPALVPGDRPAGRGKSTMILQSGLNFPTPSAKAHGSRAWAARATATGSSVLKRLLDTAGRYMNSPEEAGKWRGFLQLLRQHRQRRPLNGLIVSVSIADILHGSVEDQERVAKRLRERIQESCALLEVRLPIYLVFTKCDLIPGFTAFYRQLDDAARGEVMGKTFSHKGYEQADWGQRFSNAMDELTRYWGQMASQQLVQQDIQVTRQNNAAYRFPLELAALKPRLHQFVDSLLRQPLPECRNAARFLFHRGAAGRRGQWGCHGQHVAERFALEHAEGTGTAGSQPAPLFINSLFRKVIIPDQHLVALYTSNHRERRRKAGWVGAAGLAALVLCSLWGWSYLNNRATLASIADELAQAKADDQAASGQYTAWRSLDRLRFWAAHYHEQHHAKGVPLGMRLGLYQGHEVEPLLRNRYFAMLQNVMLKPTADNLTRTLYLLTTLKVYQRNTRELQPVSGIDSVEAEALPHDNRAQSIANFGKAALDTYVMLSPGQREHADPAFLKAHLPDYWYPAIARHTGKSMAAAGSEAGGNQDYLYASRQITFYSDQIREPDVPRILDNAFLMSSSRNYIDSLRAQSLRAIETITLESDTLFAFGRADFQSLKNEGQHQLSAIASKLLNTPNIGKIIISGHADQLGDSQGNLQVSKQRAQTIRTYLVGKGVPAELVVAQGEGSRKPLVNCDMQQPRTQLIKCLEPNRRVEIEVRGLN
jgi:type VI secretion system protein ImpL